uniref:Aldehyde dehydrogenase n=1 Tax=Trypanosoma brucei TaxID=5691 RepID=UPI0009FB94BB|nr:Chain A, Aldehyde dehydrogenase [Trypanosoma brucei]5MYP_B Chain B, Aldehyde dehydrogenase [Trypanosoma brucei]
GSMAPAGVPENTSLENIPVIVSKCREAFNDDANRDLKKRKQVLRSLLNLVEENTDEFCKAIHRDRRRHRDETVVMEILPLRNEVWHLIEHMDEYVKPVKPTMEGAAALDDCELQYEPLGVVLVIGTWNYPLLLILQPLLGALAAGNTAVIKPSELAPATAELLTKLLPKYVSSDVVGIVNGGVSETTAVLKERFDHILYTGSARVAEIVMAAAAKHLTPVTLELGGKSPVVVDDTCADNMKVVAERIMWGKIINAGQTCIAPDYVVVEKSMESVLVDALAEARKAMLGDKFLKVLKGELLVKQKQQFLEESDYPRIVNASHFQRLMEFMKGGKVAVGGEADEATLTIAPTILTNIDPTHPVMQEEIFGPILPVLTYENEKDILKIINSREKPLALYVFSNNKRFIRGVESRTSSGAVVVNDVVVHAGADGLPFGGVGRSGMGAYHGRYSFETFSHRRPVMRRGFLFSSIDTVRFPPYTTAKSRVLNSLLKPSAEVAGAVGRSVWGVAALARVVEVGYHYMRFLMAGETTPAPSSSEPFSKSPRSNE